MATIAPSSRHLVPGTRFFLVMAIVMALLNVAGFGLAAAMGISSFGAPLHVHVHAFLFFGWVVLYLTQNLLAATGSIALHRRLGWLATLWIPLMVIVGTMTTVWMAQRAMTPFFFLPAFFLVMNPITVLTFAALTTAGVVMRRDTEWHRRLIYCGMAAIMGPALGRLLPVPLLMYSTSEAIAAVLLLFPVLSIARDLARMGRVHPASWVGLAAIVAMVFAIEGIGRSPIGAALYDAVVAGTPGAAHAAHVYPPAPPMP